MSQEGSQWTGFSRPIFDVNVPKIAGHMAAGSSSCGASVHTRASGTVGQAVVDCL